VDAGLIPDGDSFKKEVYYHKTTSGKSVQKTAYKYAGIKCTATDNYDTYQINFRKDDDGKLVITANAGKKGSTWTDATNAFCGDTGYTAESEDLIHKNLWVD